MPAQAPCPDRQQGPIGEERDDDDARDRRKHVVVGSILAVHEDQPADPRGRCDHLRGEGDHEGKAECDADAGEDVRQRVGKEYPPQQLAPAAAERLRTPDQHGRRGSDTMIGMDHHRQQGAEIDRGDRHGVADAEPQDEERHQRGLRQRIGRAHERRDQRPEHRPARDPDAEPDPGCDGKTEPDGSAQQRDQHVVADLVTREKVAQRARHRYRCRQERGVHQVQAAERLPQQHEQGNRHQHARRRVADPQQVRRFRPRLTHDASLLAFP